MTANDSIGHRAARLFAEQEDGWLSSGMMCAVPNEVWSYKQRIAFRGDDENVYVTREKFSVTTSRHTQWVRRALGRAGYVTSGDHDTEEWEVWSLASSRRT